MANEKTWYSWSDYVVPDVTSTANIAKSLLWCFVQALLGNITGPNAGPAGAIPSGARWTTYYSSDGTTAGTANDGVDRWTSSFTASKIVRASSGAHSWFVLKSPAALGPYYLTVDYLSSADSSVILVLSKAAPTGGTTSLRPTATDETAFSASQFVSGSWTSTLPGKCHFTTDADGNFWWFPSRNGTSLVDLAWGVQKLTDLRITGDAFPVILVFDFVTSGALKEGTSSFYRTTAGTIKSRDVASAAATTCTVMSFMVGASSAAVDTAAAHYSDAKIDGFACLVYSTSSGAKAVKGRIPDLRTIPATLLPGYRYPASGDVESIVVGNTLVPLTAVPTL